MPHPGLAPTRRSRGGGSRQGKHGDRVPSSSPRPGVTVLGEGPEGLEERGGPGVEQGVQGGLILPLPQSSPWWFPAEYNHIYVLLYPYLQLQFSQSSLVPDLFMLVPTPLVSLSSQTCHDWYENE